jgi:DNA-binding NarL/FixJ family response regulator
MTGYGHSRPAAPAAASARASGPRAVPFQTATEPTGRESPMPRIVLAPREHTLVELLAQGHTDASAARELRVSTRTVSTIVRSLMDRLGVDNRFQLGLALGARHVVGPPPESDAPGGGPPPPEPR